MPEQRSTRASSLQLTVIVPARNEEDVLEQCLRSLVDQSTGSFRLGADWELFVVDDHSTDRTRQIALGFELPVIEPPPLEAGWTGKANALWTAAELSHGEWLLFTDADTFHQAGSLERALGEAEEADVALLSYSPRQLVTGLWQRALMPLVFSELASVYPPGAVSDPASPAAAANGQFLMVRREAYFAVGGHAAVAGSLLEDVDLARLLKQKGYVLRFRYAPDALSTRMYRSFSAMFEGWSKNLDRLFPHPLAIAARSGLAVLLLFGLPVLIWAEWRLPVARYSIAVLWLGIIARCCVWIAKSNFPILDCALAAFGLPLYSLLLIRSWFLHRVRGRVTWKGREYAAGKK